MFVRYILLLSLITLISCEGLFKNENSSYEVTAVLDKDDVLIRNGTAIDVYFMALDQESLAYVDWIPTVGDHNRIRINETVIVSTDTFWRYEEGIPIVVYYWDEDITYINSILID